jgi:hypothetical protein
MQSEILIKLLIGLKAIQKIGKRIEILNQEAFLRISWTFEKYLKLEKGDLHRAAFLTVKEECIK